MRVRRGMVAVVVLALLAGCDGASNGDDNDSRPIEAGTTGTVKLDNRLFELHVPASYNAAKPAPLVVMLHGYTSYAADAETYFKLTNESDRRGFLYAMPDGTLDSRGKQYWNATEACCDFYGGGADDSAYLSRLLGKVKAGYAVDAKRVYFIGHSNGGFMAHRMACDHANEITAIVSLAGMMTAKQEQCKPQRAVSVLQIHGTADESIAFGGGVNGSQPYPSATDTVEYWRRRDGCADPAEASVAPLDLDSSLAGAETTVTAYRTGCRNATRVELWSIKDGRHVPVLSGGFTPAAVDFMLALTAP